MVDASAIVKGLSKSRSICIDAIASDNYARSTLLGGRLVAENTKWHWYQCSICSVNLVTIIITYVKLEVQFLYSNSVRICKVLGHGGRYDPIFGIDWLEGHEP